jgi:hypothetical protein
MILKLNFCSGFFAGAIFLKFFLRILLPAKKISKMFSTFFLRYADFAQRFFFGNIALILKSYFFKMS